MQMLVAMLVVADDANGGGDCEGRDQVELTDSPEEDSMRGIRSRLTYANVVSTVTLLLVLTGGVAYAADTVFSSDIVDGEVKAEDIATAAVRTQELGTNQIRSADVRDDTLAGGGLTGADIALDTLTSDEIAENTVHTNDILDATVLSKDLADGSVRTSEVLDNSLTGADIEETSLSEVPSAGDANNLDGLDSSEFARSGEASFTALGLNDTTVDGDCSGPPTSEWQDFNPRCGPRSATGATTPGSCTCAGWPSGAGTRRTLPSRRDTGQLRRRQSLPWGLSGLVVAAVISPSGGVSVPRANLEPSFRSPA